MKKPVAVLLAFCIAVSAAACSNHTAADFIDASGDASSDVSGAVTRQDKIDLARQLLGDWEAAENDPRIAYTDGQGTTNLRVVADCIEAIKANGQGGFMGFLVGDPISYVYEIAYEPNGEAILTTYTGKDEITVRESVITDICETESFYQFTDRKGLYFSILKHSTESVLLDDYQTGSDLEGAALSAKQACEAAADANALLYGYLGYTEENNLGNPMNGYGIVIPQDFTAKAPVDPAVTVIADGAAKIGDKLCYGISFCRGDEFAGDAYYVDAETPDNLFLVSMVDGGLIPLSRQNAQHFSVPNKSK